MDSDNINVRYENLGRKLERNEILDYLRNFTYEMKKESQRLLGEGEIAKSEKFTTGAVALDTAIMAINNRPS